MSNSKKLCLPLVSVDYLGVPSLSPATMEEPLQLAPQAQQKLRDSLTFPQSFNITLRVYKSNQYRMGTNMVHNLTLIHLRV